MKPKDILAALDEAIDLAKQTGVNLEISHFKVMGEKNWPLAGQSACRNRRSAKNRELT